MRPGRFALALGVVWLLLGLATALVPGLLPAWAITGIVGGIVLVYERRVVPRQREIPLVREVPGILPVGVWTTVQLKVSNHGSRTLSLLVSDHPPRGAEVRSLPQSVKLAAGHELTLSYEVLPRTRGDVRFGRAEVWCETPRRLWERQYRLGRETQIRVLPNFRPVARYTLLAVEDRLGAMGIRLRPRRGEGLEFEQLRDYRPGDSERQIDWKATSRRQKLISREYQDDKDQRLVLLIDCGRRMRAVDGDTSHFDQVLNATLLLTYAAVRKGDAVGLATFAGVPRWVPPAKGRNAMSAVMNAVYDLPVTDEPPDFLTAATQLKTRLRRRTLVVIISNLRDEDAGDLGLAVRLLADRHLVVVASLREAALREALEEPPESLDEALTVSAGHLYEQARQRAHQRVGGRGILMIDTEPDQLPIALVNRYLEIKRRGML